MSIYPYPGSVYRPSNVGRDVVLNYTPAGAQAERGGGLFVRQQLEHWLGTAASARVQAQHQAVLAGH